MNVAEFNALSFEKAVTNKINKTLNQLKDDIKNHMYSELSVEYISNIKSNRREDFNKSIKKIASSVAKDLTNSDSGISQVLQILDRYVETYNDISSSMSDRDEAEDKIIEHVNKINKDVYNKTRNYLETIKEGVGVKKFNFTSLLNIKGVGWKTLSDLYLAIDNNTSADIGYVQGYLEFEVFRREADNNQKLWLTYSEVRKPMLEIINEGIDSYDPHEITMIANDTIRKILDNETYVKHVKASSL